MVKNLTMSFKKITYLFQLNLIMTLVVFVTPTFSKKKTPRYSSPTPYEVCSDKNKKTTENFLAFINSQYKMEADYCLDCDIYSDQILEVAKNLNPTISRACFFLSNLKGIQSNPDRFYHCGNLNEESDLLSKAPILEKKEMVAPCFNKKYIQMTFEAFKKMTKCFELLPKEKENAFHLLNHESGFILNAKSHSGARCYGQLTSEAMDHILNMVKSNRKIYTDFKSTCPEINQPGDINRLRALTKVAINDSLSSRKRYESSRHLTCHVTQEPYNCFFYSLFYFKKNLEKAKEEINKASEKITDTTLKQNPGLSTFYKNNPNIKPPIKANEVIVVTGVATSKNTKNKLTINWVFENSIAAYRSLRNLENQNLSIQTVNLFDPKKLAGRIGQWSHNGGGSISSTYFPKQLEKFKNNVVNPPKPKNAGPNGFYCKRNPSKPFCKYREKLFKSESIKFSSFHTFFSKHLNTRYRTSRKWSWAKRARRREEVSDFMNKIHRDFSHIQSQDKMKSTITELQSRGHLFQGDTKKFIDRLGKHCSFMDAKVID